MNRYLRPFKCLSKFGLLFCLSVFSQGVFAQHEHEHPHDGDRAHDHERCGLNHALANLVAAHPEIAEELAAYQRAVPELVEAGAAESRNGAVLTIPVVFHVIHGGQPVGSGPNLSVTRIQQQIDQTNLDYRRQNADAANTPALFQNVVGDMEVQFCLATVDPSGNATTGITRHQYTILNQNTIDNTIKGQTNWDPDRYLNIWTVTMPNDLNGVLGYAYPPLVSIVGTDLDGVVLNYLNVGNNPGANPASLGRTFTHEVGHYLGLPHPWSDINGNDGCFVDDGINDTPESSAPFYGCPGFPQFSCGNSAMFMNFMDYPDDDCMNSFTLGQKAVMRAVLQGNTTHNGVSYRGRANLVGNAATACGNVNPVGCYYLPLTPLQMGFETGQSLANWTFENTNGDLNANNLPVTWTSIANPNNGEYGPNSGSRFGMYFWNTNGTTGANDWLFTPCFEVEDQHTYRLAYSYACASSGGTVFPEKLKVALSTAASSGTVFSVLEDYPTVNNAYPNYIDEVTTFTITGNGDIYLGFQAYSLADQYVLQLDDINLTDITGVGVESVAMPDFGVGIYPNPTSGDVTVTLDITEAAETVRLTLANLLGQTVWEARRPLWAAQDQCVVPTGDLAAGIYFLQVRVGEKMVTRKIVVEK